MGVQLEHCGLLVEAACHPVLERWHHVHAVVQGDLGERRPHAAYPRRLQLLFRLVKLYATTGLVEG